MMGKILTKPNLLNPHLGRVLNGDRKGLNFIRREVIYTVILNSKLKLLVQ